MSSRATLPKLHYDEQRHKFCLFESKQLYNTKMFALIILFVILGFVVQQRLKSKFKKYSQEALSNGFSGARIAQKMLDDHNITDVRIESTG